MTSLAYVSSPSPTAPTLKVISSAANQHMKEIQSFTHSDS